MTTREEMALRFAVSINEQVMTLILSSGNRPDSAQADLIDAATIKSGVGMADLLIVELAKKDL